VGFHHIPAGRFARSNHAGQLSRCKLVKLCHEGVFTAFSLNSQLELKRQEVRIAPSEHR